MPEDLEAALKMNQKARATFEGFPPGQRWAYVEWINEAKRSETRAKRLGATLQWLDEGKRRNWKYDRNQAGSPGPSRRPRERGAR